MRIKQVEFRREGVPDSNGHTTSNRDPEIVVWMDTAGKEMCYTACWFKEGSESWYMETIGDRFIEYIDSKSMLRVARYAIRLLNLEKEFYEEEFHDNP